MRVSRGYGQYRVLVQPGTSCSQAAADGRSHEAKGLPHRQSSSSGPAPWRRGAATRCPLVLIQSYHFLMCSKEHVVVSCGRSAGLLLFFFASFHEPLLHYSKNNSLSMLLYIIYYKKMGHYIPKSCHYLFTVIYLICTKKSLLFFLLFPILHYLKILCYLFNLSKRIPSLSPFYYDTFLLSVSSTQHICSSTITLLRLVPVVWPGLAHSTMPRQLWPAYSIISTTVVSTHT
jgi:hypothetical protein